jgi:hypothetical protein
MNVLVMEDAKKACAYVKLDGLEKTAQLEHVKMDVLGTDSVTLTHTNASAIKTILDQIAE